MTRGRRLGIAAVLMGAAVGLAGCDQLAAQWDRVLTPDPTAARGADGAVAAPGTESVHTLRVGDCLEHAVGAAVSTARVVPCAEQHRAEVFALVELDVATYPEGDLAAARSWRACEDRFQPYVGAAYGTSGYELYPLVPSAESWEQGDKRVVCLLRPADGTAATGSARHSGR